MARRRKRKRAPGHGFQPSRETVRVNWLGPDGRDARFAISEDLIEELRRMHDEVFGAVYATSPGRFQPGYDRMAAVRLFFTRFADLNLPVVHLRIEPPTYNPKGHRIWRHKSSRQWYVTIRAERIGLKNAQPSIGRLEYLYDEKRAAVMGGGLLLCFPDDAMLQPGRKTRRPSYAGDQLGGAPT